MLSFDETLTHVLCVSNRMIESNVLVRHIASICLNQQNKDKLLIKEKTAREQLVLRELKQFMSLQELYNN